jgi:hypothetical protein
MLLRCVEPSMLFGFTTSPERPTLALRLHSIHGVHIGVVLATACLSCVGPCPARRRSSDGADHLAALAQQFAEATA